MKEPKWKKYKRVVDNKMPWQGEIDEDKKIIKVNKKKSKEKSSIIDTIVHEELHRKYPKMSEKEIKEMTKEKCKNMSEEEKAKYYKLYEN